MPTGVAAVLLGAAAARAGGTTPIAPSSRTSRSRTLDEIVVCRRARGRRGGLGRSRQALAEGVEFTRELVTEPANVIYPESFVERCLERFEGTGRRAVVPRPRPR